MMLISVRHIYAPVYEELSKSSNTDYQFYKGLCANASSVEYIKIKREANYIQSCQRYAKIIINSFGYSGSAKLHLPLGNRKFIFKAGSKYLLFEPCLIFKLT